MKKYPSDFFNTDCVGTEEKKAARRIVEYWKANTDLCATLLYQLYFAHNIGEAMQRLKRRQIGMKPAITGWQVLIFMMVMID